MPQPLSVARQKRTLNILWAAMVGAVATYWVVNVIVGQRLERHVAGPAVLTPVLLLLCVTMYLGAWAAYRAMVGAVARRATPTELQHLSDAERSQLPNRLQSAVIVCLALLETPMVFGLVHTFLRVTGPPLFEAAATLSLLGMALLRLKGFPAIFELLDRLTPSQASG